MKILKLLSRAVTQVIQNPQQAILQMKMAGWVSFLSLAVKLRPLPDALGMVSTSTRPQAGKKEDIEQNLAIAMDSVLTTELLCFRPICWKRAAVLHRYLAINGISTRIVFGMRREQNGGWHGHAWLEADGKPILEKTYPDYKVTYIFPSSEKFDLELGLLND
jgi:hypothetical protein